MLGPLVVGLSTLETPTPTSPALPWKLLAPTVVHRAGKRRGIPVADSKKLHKPSKNDLSGLEIGVLTFITCERGSTPRTFRELIDHLTAGRADYLDAYPWYRGQDVDLPFSLSSLELVGATRRLDRALERAQVRVAEVRAIPVEVTEFNQTLAERETKGEVNAWAIGRFLGWLGRQNDRDRADVWVDRLGGRLRYGPFLYPLFPGARLQIVEQEHESQCYDIEFAKDRLLRIHFQKEGEEACFATALASMTAKYVRELHMALFNRWWRQQDEALRPTAGYPQDARRFLSDIGKLRARLGIDPALLIRKR